MSVSSINNVRPSLFEKIVHQKHIRKNIPNYRYPVGGGFHSAPPGPPPPGEFSVGVNMSGIYSSVGVAPITPSVTNFQYYTNMGINKFRLLFGWSVTQPFAPFQTVGVQLTNFAALDTGYLSVMDQAITNAIAAGGQCLLDCHMFMNGPGGFLVGSAQVPTTALADMWGKLAAHYVANPSLLAGIYGLELMNEPTNGFPISTCIAAYQQCVTSIRAAGYTGDIYLDGTNFASAWNWSSGTGQPSSSDTLDLVTDPLNRLIFSAHMYPDANDSGQGFAYAVEIATAGSAPVGLNTNPDIGVQRTSREYEPWLSSKQLRGHMGEYGTSNDSPLNGGVFNYDAWNTLTFNLLDYLKTNKIPISLWQAGPGFSSGFGGYPYSLDPFNSNLSGATDFTSSGVQVPLLAPLQDYMGVTVAHQPTAYALFKPNFPNASPYLTVGSPSGNFTIYYGGKITSPVTITPHDTLVDGTTSAGGTFTPSSITLQPGLNALATFTYTPSQANTILISATNNASWANPPAIGQSSNPDNFATLVNTSSIIALRRIKNDYIGPAIRLISPINGSQQDFFFNNRGDLPRQAIQNFAGVRNIKIARIYSQNGNSQGDYIPILNNLNFTPSLNNPPSLSLVNADGYPEVTVSTGQWMGTQAASTDKGLLTLVARVKGAGVYLSQDNFSVQFRLNAVQVFVAANGTPLGSVATGTISSYATVGATYSNLYTTNNLNGYNNGSLTATASVAAFTFSGSGSQTFINAFRFGGQDFNGAWQEQVISFDEASSTVEAAFASSDATYYATPLPDTLSALNPVITGTGPINVTVSSSISPFSLISITDSNTGTPTDSVVITGVGTAGGTLTGTGLTGTGPWSMAAAIPGTITSQMRALTYTPAGSASTTETFTVAVTSSAGTSASDSHTVVTVTGALNPTINNTGATNCIVGKTNTPFAIPAPFGGAALASIIDPNTGTPTDTVTFTLSGTAGGTLSGTGLSGSGPYTMGPAIPSTINSQMATLTYTPTGSLGQTETITVNVSSSTGTSATNSSTIITLVIPAPAETPLAAPGGTFTPINKCGPNIIAASGGYPDTGGFQHIYPQNAEIDYWASIGCGSIRVPILVLRLQPLCYGPLDPPTPRFDNEILSYPGGPYPTGTQINIAEIKRVLDRARSHNMYVQLEFHNSGVLTDRQNNKNRTLGNDPEATNIAVDVWQRMATVFQNYDNAIFEYFNEPGASTAAGNFTAQTTIAAAIASITTLQWNYLPTNSDSLASTYVSRGEPAVWNTWVPPAGLKWALVLHQYLNLANNGFTADVVLNKGSTVLASATTSMRAAGLKAVLTETGWSPSNTIVSPGTGVPSTEGNAILNFCKTNNDVFIGWNFWLGGDYVFEAAWNAAGHSVFSAVPQGLNPAGPIVDAPQVSIMQANFV